MCVLVVLYALHVLIVLVALAGYEYDVALFGHHAGCAYGLALFTQERSFCLFKQPKSCIMAGNHENPLTYPTQQRFHAH